MKNLRRSVVGSTDEEEGNETPSLSQEKLTKNHNYDMKHSGSNDIGWKALSFLLVLILMLFVTETIQVKKPQDTSTIELKHPSIKSNHTNDNIDAEVQDATSQLDESLPAPSDLGVSDTEAISGKESSSSVEINGKVAKKIVTETRNASLEDMTSTPIELDPPDSEQGSAYLPNTNHINPIYLDMATGTTRHTYKRRGQPMTDEDRESMIKKWGSWTLVDDKERPTTDYYASYPNRDIPRSKFPSNAWQIDTEHLSKFLPEAISLVERTQQAILAEYGQAEGSFEERAEMFELEMFDTLEKASYYIITKAEWRKDSQGDRGGWSTYRSLEGLKRRLLHAVMTEDSFIFAMGGHSAAAGHGNLFVQSYTTQVQWILEAVFARLGVRHQSKNFANGGLGTIQHGLAASSVYGPAIDMLMWDSSMTEKDGPSVEVFARQALTGGVKVPVLWGLTSEIAKELNLYADADVGAAGRGTFAMKEAETLEEIETMPWAARYVKCGNDFATMCKEHKYLGHCWDDNRTDIVPPVKQDKYPGGQAGWHPGNRRHQALGRVLAFTILQSLKGGLKEWNESENYEIADGKWHVTDWYNNIRSKLDKLGPEFGYCKQEETFELDWVCKYPVKGRTEFTPRAHPSLSNIRTLMPPEMVSLIPEPDRPLYEPPEQFNPDLHPPPGAVDVLSIVEAGVDFKSTLNPDYATPYYKKPAFTSPPKVPLGKGVGLITKAGDEYCDGTVDAFCGKGPEDTCLLAGTNDGRNGLIFDSLSGWTVLNIPDLKYGYVALKFETTHGSGENPQTKDMIAENMDNESNNERKLKQTTPPPEYCEQFTFEFAIDGVITVWNKDKFLERLHQVQRVVETVTILKDPNYTNGQEKEVEVAFRITGCERMKTFVFSHIYWA